MSGWIVTPDCRNGASACRIPLPRLICASAAQHAWKPRHRLAEFLSPPWSSERPGRPRGHGKDADGVRRGIDEECARRHRRRLHRQDRIRIVASYAASSALAADEQGAPADVFARRHRLDGWRSARRTSMSRRGSICSAQPRADRRKGFQNRQCHDPTGPILQQSSATADATADATVPVGKYARFRWRNSAHDRGGSQSP